MKVNQWDYAVDGDPVDKINAQRDAIVHLNIKLDRANDEIARLKNLLAECEMNARQIPVSGHVVTISNKRPYRHLTVRKRMLPGSCYTDAAKLKNEQDAFRTFLTFASLSMPATQRALHH